VGRERSLLRYSNTWQLVINTSTTIATFLMVFLLQSTQNRDTKAINIKLDELLRAIEGARTGLADLGDLTDAEIDKIERELVSIARKSGLDAVRSATRYAPSTARCAASGARAEIDRRQCAWWRLRKRLTALKKVRASLEAPMRSAVAAMPAMAASRFLPRAASAVGRRARGRTGPETG
jgi:low affinity Fe/Cu permease